MFYKIIQTIMSRIGKKPITIPEGVSVNLKDSQGKFIIEAKGKLGELSLKIPSIFNIEKAQDQIKISPKKISDLSKKEVKALWGTYRSHINNLLIGISQGFSKELEIHGIGYKAQVLNGDLILELGYSHPIIIKAVPGINFKVERNVIKVTGIDKQKVGEIAQKIRKTKDPDPYKGMGIRYKGEIIRKKAGKKLITVK